MLQSRLEGEADKDALQKSDAAGEAILAELAQDKKSPKGKELEILKQAREKSKDKKKVKDQKKSKDMKVSRLIFQMNKILCNILCCEKLLACRHIK